MHRIDRREEIGHRRRAAAGKIVELELIGGDDVRDREHALLDELRNAPAHKDAAAGVADHRIAAIARRRICALHQLDGIEHGTAGVGRDEIAGEHAVAFAQHAALRDALHHQADARAAEDAAAPGAIAGMVGKLHGVHRPDLDADALKREHGGGVADMAVGDMGLDRQDVHARPGERARVMPEPVAASEGA